MLTLTKAPAAKSSCFCLASCTHASACHAAPPTPTQLRVDGVHSSARLHAAGLKQATSNYTSHPTPPQVSSRRRRCACHARSGTTALAALRLQDGLQGQDSGSEDQPDLSARGADQACLVTAYWRIYCMKTSLNLLFPFFLESNRV